jgi:hypothetical protein
MKVKQGSNQHFYKTMSNVSHVTVLETLHDRTTTL